MTLNFQHARDLMVKNQLRPNRINEKNILELFKTIPKENFVPENYKDICYADKDLEILNQRGYLKNLHLAQIVHNANIKANEIVLHIGGLTGYLSFIISKLCKKLFILEEDVNVFNNLKENILIYKLINTEVINENHQNGYQEKSPYDTIIIDCPKYLIEDKIYKQLNKNNGKLIYIKKIKDNFSKAYKITRNENNYNNEYLFDVFTPFTLDKERLNFKF